MALNPLNAASAAHSLKPLALGVAAAGSTAAISFIASAALNRMVKPEQFVSKLAVEAVSVVIGAATALAVGASSVAVLVGYAVYGAVASMQVILAEIKPISSEQVDWSDAKAFVKARNLQDGSGVVVTPANALVCSTSKEGEEYTVCKNNLKGIDSLNFTIVELESRAVTFNKPGESKISVEHLKFYKEEYADGRVEIRVAFKEEAPDLRSFIGSTCNMIKAIYHATRREVPYQLIGGENGNSLMKYYGNETLLKGGEGPVCKEAAKMLGPMLSRDMQGLAQLENQVGDQCGATYHFVHPHFGACVSIYLKSSYWDVDGDVNWDRRQLHVFPLAWSDGAVHLDMDKELVHVGDGKFDLKREGQEHAPFPKAEEAPQWRLLYNSLAEEAPQWRLLYNSLSVIGD